MGVTLFSQVTNIRTRANGLSTTGSLHWLLRKNFLIESVVKHWNRLSREESSHHPWSRYGTRGHGLALAVLG